MTRPLSSLLIESKVRTDIDNMAMSVPYTKYGLSAPDYAANKILLKGFYQIWNKHMSSIEAKFKTSLKIYCFKLYRLNRVIWLVESLIGTLGTTERDEALKSNIEKFKKEYVGPLLDEWVQHNPKIKPVMNRFMQSATQFEDFLKTFKHYAGIDYYKIRDYEFGWTDPETVYEDFQKLEWEYADLQRAKDAYRPLEEMEEIIVDMGEYKWINTHKRYCEDEGRRMAHCGNAGGNSDDVVLSLRHFKKGRAKPVLTFILDTASGDIGEMKGFANEKPDKKYHPYILRLFIEYKEIDKIGGGGYAPERNFSVYDLSDQDYETLLAARSDILLDKDLIGRTALLPELFNKYVSGQIAIGDINRVKATGNTIVLTYDSIIDERSADMYKVMNEDLIGSIQHDINGDYDSALFSVILDDHSIKEYIHTYKAIFMSDKLMDIAEDMLVNPAKYLIETDTNDEIVNNVMNIRRKDMALDNLCRYITYEIWSKVPYDLKSRLMNTYLSSETPLWDTDNSIIEDFKIVNGRPIITLDSTEVSKMAKVRNVNYLGFFKKYCNIQSWWSASYLGIKNKDPQIIAELNQIVDSICNRFENDRYFLDDVMISNFY